MKKDKRYEAARKNGKEFGYPGLKHRTRLKSDVSTSTILYRFDKGENMVHPGGVEPRAIAATFDEQQTVQAIRDNQQGKTDYPGFMNEIAVAGVRLYEATLTGSNKRVTYIGRGGSYEEAIPI